MKIRLVIFDFDGTIGDTRRNIVMTMQQTMKECGLPVLDEATCCTTIGMPLRQCFTHILPNLTSKEADLCVETYERVFAENLKKVQPEIFPHVREVLFTLQQEGIQMAIASSRSSESLIGFLRAMNIADYFSCVLGAEDVSRPKPAPEPVLTILSRLGKAADETMVVGDMPVDVQMGANSGAHTCIVTFGNATPNQIEEAGAEFIIDEMSQLVPLIDM